MAYVDGFVLPVPRKNLKAYVRMARAAKKMWLKSGTRTGTCFSSDGRDHERVR
jgi:uncharacterized protein YbaA (DUF1428 family)